MGIGVLVLEGGGLLEVGGGAGVKNNFDCRGIAKDL